MANKNDGQTKQNSTQQPSGHPEKIVAYGEDALDALGNKDAKLLASKFKELSKDGLSKEDKKELQKLDNELKGAEYKAMGNNVTLVVQEKGNI